MAPSCPRYSFRLLLPGVLGFGSVRHEPCPTTNFFFSFFRWREEGATSVFRVPANHLASTFFLPVSGDPREVTEYKHMFLTVILWWLATVKSNKRIVVILFLSSQWDTTWHYERKYIRFYHQIFPERRRILFYNLPLKIKNFHKVQLSASWNWIFVTKKVCPTKKRQWNSGLIRPHYQTKRKTTFLNNYSNWKYIYNYVVQNISNIGLSILDIKTLQSGLNFATGVKNYNLINLINLIYSLNDSDFKNGFMQGLITVTANINTDNYALPKRHKAALKVCLRITLSLHNNFNINSISTEYWIN